jgi:hypothetical protein
MKGTLLETCRIGLLTTLLAASFPQAGLAGLTGTGNLSVGTGNQYVFLVSSTPLASSLGG